MTAPSTCVFICRCDAAGVDAQSAAALAEDVSAAFPDAAAHVVESGCSPRGIGGIVESARSLGCARVLVASCAPGLHMTAFRGMLANAGTAECLVVNPFPDGAGPAQRKKAFEAVRDAMGKLAPCAEPRREKPVPRALVVGGGVAGIQASLDIANAGYKVTLVEKESSIGGHMLQLSEVFPTLDCPQCIMTPKMVEVAQHDNIDLRACSEVEFIEGEAGKFRAVIRRKAAFIDWAKCTGCGECSAACPVEIYSDWDRGTARKKATSRPFAQAVPNKFRITKNGVSPCRAACPAACNAHGYVAFASQGKWAEAYSLITERIPFPGIVGRVCPHPCEDACHRRGVDQAVSICVLKRFVADRMRGREPLPVPAPDHGKKVAVVGAGPAGLTAALKLKLKGYKVCVFEASDRPGGMLVWGIPSYRLPRDVVRDELALPAKLGVEMHFNRRLGPDISVDGLRREFDAVVLALGAGKSWKLGIEGENLGGVTGAVEFLARVNRGEVASVRGRVLVIGGGNTAFDAARSAIRLGAENVTIAYRRSIEEMPANPGEVEGAGAEGVKIVFLATPLRILGDGKAGAVEFLRNELGPPDKTGRRRPVAVQGSEFRIEADLVVSAIGQAPDAPFLDNDARFAFRKTGALDVDMVTLQTGVKGVFAAGDVVSGPDTVVGAIASGMYVAESVDLFLTGADPSFGREPPALNVVEKPDLRAARAGERAKAAEKAPGARRGDFTEFDLGITEEQAIAEARRCLNCAGCCECMNCVKACEPKAVDHAMQDRFEEVEAGAVVLATGYDLYPVAKIEEYAPDPDVIDGLQFERLLCPSGPTDGRVLRPSDGKEPKDVVLVACAGSRDPEHHKPYCSRVCCLYSTKLAMLYRHAVHGGKVHYFYIDVRTDGKMYEEFYQRAQQEEGVNYVKGKVSKIYRVGDRLRVLGADLLAGKSVSVDADMVVLAMAMVPNQAGIDLGRKLGIAMNEHGFMTEQHGLLMPLESSRPGFFFAGTCQGPKDIPECVAHASGTAGRVLSFFGRKSRPAEVKKEPASAVAGQGS